MPKGKTTTTKEHPSEFPVRGNEFVGKVVSAKAPKTITVEREITVYVPKFERYKKIRSKVHAHNPDYMHAKEGDIVRIGETRKISKTKAFIVTEIVGHSKIEAKREEMKEGMRVKAHKAEAKAEEEAQ
ncbi:MAG: 30S ribosomal protein S17 [Candidatus Iainarchaeum archaeon]|uniref:30S ribosomal protein S17 n=1 Tax=Candidatus Iainarchaeum sp. TaxID=3101447 RepID=A0A7T9DKE9_9ARCH|nr:MAG: 30S ribosomal protein S17 [Candidatus Diapherotrites archaeon]